MTKQTIQVSQEVKDDFEKLRFKLKLKNQKLITQDEFVKILITEWKTKQ